ncbi:MAG: DUF4384 domain-containing protein [Candidatus Glassbacteria bacterium]|nr:DUF4384 domain-containing protein [Candidatus Glassbacteria bacterium]
MNRFILPLVVMATLVSVDAYAEWVQGRGEWLFGPDTTENEACEYAEQKARKDAIRKVTGEHLSTEDMMVCSDRGDEASCKLNQMTWSTIDGAILDIRSSNRQTVQALDGYNKCVITLEADVGVAAGRPDPGFDMTVELNERTFRSGEPLVITIEPTRPMYISVFQWLPYEEADHQVQRIFPNSFDRNSRFTKRGTIPTKGENTGYDLKVTFPEANKVKGNLVDEYLMVVGTRKAFVFRETYTLEEFNARLLEIPRQDRRDVRRAYYVVRPK